MSVVSFILAHHSIALWVHLFVYCLYATDKLSHPEGLWTAKLACWLSFPTVKAVPPVRLQLGWR